ncbi:MAG: NAD(P)-dependent oxidoreductase, partial [Candidatus Omnitrophota bacterium]
DRREYPLNAKYFNIDVRNQAQLNNVFKGLDIVIHAAAALPLWKEKDIFDININGTKNVLEAAKNNSIKKLVYISSTAVYGIPKEHPLYEDGPLVGVGPYGESKIKAEGICQSYRDKGLAIAIVRPKSFIGTGRLGVFQILYDWVESGKKIPIIGAGWNRYQLLDVEDLVEAIYLLITVSGQETSGCFNLGAEEFRTVKEDVGALCDYAGTGARVMATPAWIVKPLLAMFEKLNLSPLYKWIYATADKDSFVSNDKIKFTLGWLPRYSNKDALIKSYKWYLEHKKELSGAGITHRVAWKQGILALAKIFL